MTKMEGNRKIIYKQKHIIKKLKFDIINIYKIYLFFLSFILITFNIFNIRVKSLLNIINLYHPIYRG